MSVRQGRSRHALAAWFLPGIHVKRWLLLLFFSILMLSLGAEYALRNAYSTIRFPEWVQTLTLQFLPRLVRASLFAVLGVALLLLSFYKLGQSILGPLIGARGGDAAGIIDRLYSYRMLSKGPRVVTIGGGTGLSSLLRGIKKYTGNIVAIVTVADDGGSSGRIRSQYRILPPGDFRQCLTALAETEPLMTQLFQHRFSGTGDLGGHSFGNLFITAMTEITGDFEHALRESGRVLAVRGQIVPSTLQDILLCAEAGREIRIGESSVPHGLGEIDRVFLDPPDPPINPEAQQAILDADIVLIGPGSLYTSILPNLLVDGMAMTLRSTTALKVYICNVASQPGETLGFSVSKHLEVIEQHVGEDLFDYVIVNSNLSYPLPEAALEAGISRVLFDKEQAMQRPIHYVLADVVSKETPSHHDPDKLAKVIMRRIWR
ncbi:MAG: gluconeogenesis factor YvcK family protein [Candidatus Dormibacteria bacterium]